MTSWKQLSQLCKKYSHFKIRNYNSKTSLGNLFEKKGIIECLE